MADQDPSSGRAFIWLISCFLLISIIAGGGCLVAYMILPESEVAPWLPNLGVVLVCLPWAFWLLTFIYRVFSRALGFRLDGHGGGGGGGEKRNGGSSNLTNDSANVDVKAACGGAKDGVVGGEGVA